MINLPRYHLVWCHQTRVHTYTHTCGAFRKSEVSAAAVTAEWTGDIMSDSRKVNQNHSRHVWHNRQVKVVPSITIRFHQSRQAQRLCTSARCPRSKCFFRNRIKNNQTATLTLSEGGEAKWQQPASPGHIIYSPAAAEELKTQKYSVLISNGRDHFCWR